MNMKYGKDTWCQFATERALFKSARESGHVGICINHHAWDRAVFSSLDRKHRQAQQFVEKAMPDVPGRPPKELLSLCNWMISTPCCGHDAHNGLKWSLGKFVVEGSEISKSLHIGVESLRSGYDLLIKELGGWLMVSIEFVDAGIPHAQDLWTSLSIEPSWVELLLDLKLHFKKGRLCISRDFADDDSLAEKVSSVLLHVWRFKKYTDSRWVTIGESCRTVLIALLTGIDSLISRIRSNPKTATFTSAGGHEWMQKFGSS